MEIFSENGEWLLTSVYLVNCTLLLKSISSKLNLVNMISLKLSSIFFILLLTFTLKKVKVKKRMKKMDDNFNEIMLTKLSLDHSKPLSCKTTSPD